MHQYSVTATAKNRYSVPKSEVALPTKSVNPLDSVCNALIMSGDVEDVLTKKYGLDPLKRDTNSEWVALDYGGVIVHVFTDRMREFYNIERLWADGGNVLRRGE